MLKENLKMIFKNRITYLILLLLVAVIVCFSLSKVFNEYQVFEKYVYNGEYVVKKPFAIDVFSRCEDAFAAVILLTSCISLAFFIYKNDSFDNMTTLRGNIIRQRIYSILAIAIVTAIFFYIAYLFGMFTFYFTCGTKMNPDAYSDYVNGTNYSGLIYVDNDKLMNSLFWMNKGNTTYLYFIVHGFFCAIMMFCFTLLTASFAFLFKPHMQVIVFIICSFVFMVGNSYFYDNIFTSLVQMPSLFYDHSEYDGIYLLSWLCHPLIFITLSGILIYIQSLQLKLDRN